ncbi:MAG: methyltransferase [Pseudooceanicola sp.]|nr:methyltransferase [Pseudooceanicola sp.]
MPYNLDLIPLGAAIILITGAVSSLAVPRHAFWPPPDMTGWQSRLFRLLFRIMVAGLLVTSLWHLWQQGWAISPGRGIAAGLLLISGFAIAFFATGRLGWDAAFGAKQGLKTDGLFAYSRNPIYLATWFGLVGWGLLVPDPVVIAILAVWGGLYVVAVFLEERWLAETYGADFAAYRKVTPRFL